MKANNATSDYTQKPHWTNFSTKLKMSTMDRVLREYHTAHGTTDRRSANDVHIWLARQFGHIGTIAGLRRALEIDGGYGDE